MWFIIPLNMSSFKIISFLWNHLISCAWRQTVSMVVVGGFRPRESISHCCEGNSQATTICIPHTVSPSAFPKKLFTWPEAVCKNEQRSKNGIINSSFCISHIPYPYSYPIRHNPSGSDLHQQPSHILSMVARFVVATL